MHQSPRAVCPDNDVWLATQLVKRGDDAASVAPIPRHGASRPRQPTETLRPVLPVTRSPSARQDFLILFPGRVSGLCRRLNWTESGVSERCKCSILQQSKKIGEPGFSLSENPDSPLTCGNRVRLRVSVGGGQISLTSFLISGFVHGSYASSPVDPSNLFRPRTLDSPTFAACRSSDGACRSKRRATSRWCWIKCAN